MAELNKARELFIKYNGSSFHMEQDGVLEEYKSFIWLEEYQKKLLRDSDKELVLGSSFMALFQSLSQTSNEAIIGNLVKTVESNISSYDAFTKLRIAEELIKLAKRNMNIKKMLEQKASILLESIKTNDFRVADFYNTDSYMSEVLKKENVLKRVNKRLAEI